MYNLKWRWELFKVEGFKKKLLVFFFTKRLLTRFTTISKPKLSEQHWDVIKRNLPQNYNSVLDIGAGRGFFSFKFLEEKPNVQITAIEAGDRRYKIIESIRKIFGYENLLTERMAVNYFKNETIESMLVPHDITLLISVYHQMYISQPNSFQTLEKIWKATKKCMFFAMADARTDNKAYREPLLIFGTDTQSIKKNITKMLEKLPDSKVEYLGDYPYFGEKSPRMFFKVVRNGKMF